MRCLVLAACAAFALPGAATADTAAGRLQSWLDGLRTLRAEFRQTVTDADGRVVDRAEGRFALARPGRFRWDYRVPEQLIVSDGRDLWHYDVELEQVTVRRTAEAVSGTPAALLAGEGALADSFEVSEAGAGDGLDWLLLRPRGADSDFTELRLAFAGTELRRMRLADRLGQTTQLEFSRIERNPRLEAGQFRFAPPAGVDVIGKASR